MNQATSYILRDLACYTARTYLLRAAREADFRLTPLYALFAQLEALTRLRPETDQETARRRLVQGGGWTFWNQCEERMRLLNPGVEWRWRVRVDAVGDDACLLFGIETSKRLPGLVPTAANINLLLDRESAQFKELWRQSTESVSLLKDGWTALAVSDNFAADRLYTTGQAWVFTVEWEGAPDWREIAARRFNSEPFIIAEWGVLGVKAEKNGEAEPLFELHSSADPQSIQQRDAFLFNGLPDFLLHYLKVTQLLRRRYQQHFTAGTRRAEGDLLRVANAVRNTPRRVSLRESETYLGELAAQMSEYRAARTALAFDLHTAQVDAENAATILRRYFPAEQVDAGSLLRPLKVYLGQIQGEIQYVQLTLEEAAQAVEFLKAKNDILRVRFTNILAVLGVGFGIFLGLGQLIEPNYLKDFLKVYLPIPYLRDHGNIARAVLCLALSALTSLGVYRLLNRFLADKKTRL